MTMKYIQIGSLIVGLLLSLIGIYRIVVWYGYWRANYKGKLLTEGPYKTVRHPYYAAFLILITGIVLLVQIFETIALVILSYPVVIFYVSKEEEELIKKYGKRYRDYMEKVPWRLIPHVW